MRPLVDRQVAADAVAGAVVVVEPGVPERRAGEGVELGAGRPLREARHGERDVAAEDAREPIPLLGRRRADRRRSGSRRSCRRGTARPSRPGTASRARSGGRCAASRGSGRWRRSGPAPEIVGKLTSRKRDSSARRASRRSAALISVRRPAGASRASHARNRLSAMPSFSCALRAPASSTSFLRGLGEEARDRRPAPPSRRRRRGAG